MLNAQEITRLRSLLTREDDRLPIVFNALSDPKRCLVFRSFLKKDHLCVSDIAHLHGISMSLASQQLKILEITGLLIRERKGRSVYFKPNTDDALVLTIIKAVK